MNKPCDACCLLLNPSVVSLFTNNIIMKAKSSIHDLIETPKREKRLYKNTD